jgi:signal transduction histidine kinase
MQIRTGLTLRFIAIAAGILAITLLYVYESFKHNVEISFRSQLISKVNLTTNTILTNEKTLAVLPPITANDEGDTLSFRENISIFNDAFERVYSLQPDAQPVAVKTLQEIQSNGSLDFKHVNLHGYGVIKTGASSRNYFILAEGYCDPKSIIQLRNILIISFLLGIGAVALGGWYFAGQALQPMRNIVQQVDAIHASNLNNRVTSNNKHDEIAHLSETFNHLLDRVEQAFKMQKQFISNVSHELKNPITVMRTQIEVALQRERNPENYQQTFISLLDDLSKLTQVHEKLLQLAKLHSEDLKLDIEPVRIDELLWQVRETVLKTHPQAKITIQLDNMPTDDNELEIPANEALLRTAILNLIENGCKYGFENRVLVHLNIQPHGAHFLKIINQGEVIPKEEIALLFEPFYRSPRHIGVKGSGIGLSLTKSILQQHQISMDLSSDLEHGTVFLLKFPNLSTSSIKV